MKIIHLSTKDFAGGAARAAYRLHQGLTGIGLDSQMLVANKSSQDESVHVVQTSMQLLPRINRWNRKKVIERDLRAYSKTRLKSLEFFSHCRSRFGSSITEQLAEADVINLHWTAGLLDYTGLFGTLPKDKPVVWTLHDMNPFTGGCHYNVGCELFTQQCAACPQLGSSKQLDLSFKIFKEKGRALRTFENLSIVTPSQWLAVKAKHSKLFRDRPITVIPSGLDTAKFSPRDRVFSREVLGIPQDANVVLFLAEKVTNMRKGMNFLYEALKLLSKDKNLFLVTAGQGKPKNLQNVRMLHLGTIDQEQFLSVVYSAADLFVMPSLQDNLPNTVIESMSCGTPVVAFDTGGVPDMVRPGETGYLAEKGSAQDLAEKIAKALTNPQLFESMRMKCRQVAINEYQIDQQAKRYSALYESIVSHTPHPGAG